jgi:hypothetical protein
MGIKSIEDSKILKKCFDQIGREGVTKRAIELFDNYLKENPEHNYKEMTKLIGRFHALYISIDNGDYWKEIANKGYNPELYDLVKYTREYEDVRS